MFCFPFHIGSAEVAVLATRKWKKVEKFFWTHFVPPYWYFLNVQYGGRRSTAVMRWWFSVMFSRRFAVMSFGLMLFALCSVLHKVSSVPQGISQKHNFVLCRAIFYLCGNRFRFLCFVISYKKAQKSRPAIKAFCLYTGRPAMPSPISCSESFI